MAAEYYEILGVARTASEQEIKSAYRKLALKFHPDRNPGDKEAEETFKAAAEAYSVLGDPDKRTRYDTYGHAGVSSGGGGFDPTIFADFGDILGEFFGFGGGRARGPRRGADLRYNLDLSFSEAAFGTETQLQIPRSENCDGCEGSGSAPGTQPTTCPTCSGAGQVRFQQGFFAVARTCSRCGGAGRVITKPCPKCNGQGALPIERKLQIKIPAGVDTGSQLRVAGEGEPGPGGGPHGDLYVVVRAEDHPFFRREGPHLFCEVPVSFAQATLGATLEIPTAEGGQTTLKVSEGTQTGTTLRIRGQGVPNLGFRGRGDLHVSLQVVVPTKLSAEQRRLIEQLAKTLPTPEIRATAEKDRSFKSRLKDILG